MPFNDYEKQSESYSSMGGGFGSYGDSPVSTFAMNSTISAYKELESIRKLNPEKYEEKEKEFKKNLKNLSEFESRLLLLNSLLQFSPTFVFGVLGYSLITSHENWQAICIFLGVFLMILGAVMIKNANYRENIYLLGEAQNTLKKEIGEVRKSI